MCSRFLVIVGLVALAGCGGSGNSTTNSSTNPPQRGEKRALKIVALGDSDTTGIGDSTRQGWVRRYAALVQHKFGSEVDVANLAADGKTSNQLLSEVQSNPTTQRDLRGAQIVLLGIGGADINAGDENLQAGRCKGRACYQPLLRQFDRNFDATVAAVRRLVPRSTLIRAISLPNGYPGAGDAIPPFVTADVSLYQATTERKTVCEAMRSHAGKCIDVVRAFNGPRGTDDAYKAGLMTKDPCCYPSAEGQQLMARLLYGQGLGRLEG